MLHYFTILLSISILLASCTNGHENHLQGKKVFRYNQAEGLSSLDPAFARNQATVWASSQIFNGLFELDEQLNVAPALAEDWSVSKDGLAYTFRIKKGVYFHDNKAFPNQQGREVTAADFVYSFKRLLDPATRSTGAWVFGDKVLRNKKGIISDTCFKAIDTYAFRVYLAKPFPAFLELLATPYTFVVPKEAIERYGREFKNNPVGTGPFVFNTWEDGVLLTLLKNNRYWRKDDKAHSLPYLDAVQVSFISDKAAALQAFQKGTLSLLSGIGQGTHDLSPEQTGLVRAASYQKYTLLENPNLRTTYLGFQLDAATYAGKHHPLLDKRVRQALNLAIQRQATAATVSPVHYLADKAGNAGKKVYEYNPNKAKLLLKEAGYPQGQGLPTLTLHINSLDQQQITQLKKQWAAIGVTVAIEVNKAVAHQQLINEGEAAFFNATWSGEYADAENYLSMFYSKNFAPFGLNKTHFRHARFDHLYEKALAESNTNRRYQLYQEMESILSEEAPVIILPQHGSYQMIQNTVEGLRVNALNHLNLEKVDIRRENKALVQTSFHQQQAPSAQ